MATPTANFLIEIQNSCSVATRRGEIKSTVYGYDLFILVPHKNAKQKHI